MEWWSNVLKVMNEYMNPLFCHVPLSKQKKEKSKKKGKKERDKERKEEKKKGETERGQW